jgi:hypothetical protein
MNRDTSMKESKVVEERLVYERKNVWFTNGCLTKGAVGKD